MSAAINNKKPPQEKNFARRASRRRNRSVTADRTWKNRRSRYDFTSGVPMFANGAISAAFVAAFSNVASTTKSRNGGRASSANLTDEQRAALDKAIGAVNEELNQRHGTFASTEEAAKFLHEKIGPLSRQYGVEIGANIFNGSMPNTSVVFGVTTQYYTNQVTLSGRSGFTISASFHTHGSSEYSLLFNSFSDNDIAGITHSAYLSAPSGNLYHFNYSAFSASGMSDTIANRRLFIGGVQ